MNHKGEVSQLLLSIFVDVFTWNMVLIVSLEKGSLVSHSSAYSIMRGHDLFKLIKSLEYVNSYSTIKSRGLQNPQVLLSMATLRELIGCLDGLLSAILHLLQLCVELLDGAIDILLNKFESILELLHLVTYFLLEVINHNGEGHLIIDVSQFLLLIVCLQVQKQAVLGRQVPVTVHVVHQLLQAVLADEVVLDAVRSGLPFEVVK